MRTIKFRGLDRANEQWVYGDLVVVGDDYHILEEWEIEANDYNKVDKESVGQFTDVLGIGDEEIYEGDIVTNRDDFDDTQYVVRYCDGGFVICEILNGDIEEALSRDIYESPDSDKIYSIGTFCEGWKGENYLQVVGNVYEHKLKTN